MAIEFAKEPEKKKRKLGLKTRIALFELLIIIAMSLAGWYFWDRIQAANQYKSEYEKLVKEKERCGELISQQEGSFEDYEYCKTLLQKF